MMGNLNLQQNENLKGKLICDKMKKQIEHIPRVQRYSCVLFYSNNIEYDFYRNNTRCKVIKM